MHLNAKKYSMAYPWSLFPTHWHSLSLSGIGPTSGVDLSFALLLNIASAVPSPNHSDSNMWHSFLEKLQATVEFIEHWLDKPSYACDDWAPMRGVRQEPPPPEPTPHEE